MILPGKIQLKISEKTVFWAFGTILIGAISVGLIKNTVFALLAPLSVIFLFLALNNYRILYYLLIFSLPFSIHTPVGGGLTLDVPTEPLMVALMGCYLLSFLLGARPDKRFFSHPLIILTGLLYFWALFLTLYSVDTLKSVKYMLAKAWYIVPFLLFTGSYVKSVKDVRKILWIFLVPLTLIVSIALVKHALLGFAFDAVQQAVVPFFRNHVIYAAIIALAIPYVFTLLQLERKSLKGILLVILVILLLGVAFSYTRASWLSLPIAAFYYLAIRFKITKLGVATAYLGAALGLGYMINQNTYMLYAPEYEKTIFYGDNFEKHLEATYNFEDVSGMERVYRWVAAVNMAYDKPLIGSGPNTFYPEYKKHTVKSFRTYVSDNPEKSTTHNYFLLQLAEQGIIGAVLLLILVAYLLILPQTLYHRTRKPEYRALITGAGLCLVVIIFHLTLNELIEVDKVGSFFYISIALLVKLDLWTREERRQETLLETAGK
ncbi:O-antigen ligase family protein [Adhaeribacter soli]|uniref:O-antigen ligase family protein n=1 Tax=Adhaeribacter soli TaxID=2607655 RepID=A0A5N1J408_9BACT|nr:O-antigen ligase family protein [Adhaeribacter soli]KAA9345636.1 O-antigen ligase family protein [Adhaeribacter soli]